MKLTPVQASDLRKTVGRRVARLRRQYKMWTQYDLALASGCRPEAISRIERGSVDFGITKLLRIAAALEISPAVLLPELLFSRSSLSWEYPAANEDAAATSDTHLTVQE